MTHPYRSATPRAPTEFMYALDRCLSLRRWQWYRRWVGGRWALHFAAHLGAIEFWRHESDAPVCVTTAVVDVEHWP